METLYITGAEARAIRRLARRGAGIELEQVDSPCIRPLNMRWSQESTDDLRALRKVLNMRSRPLEVRVPSHETRVRGYGVKSVICSTRLPGGSFERVVAAQGPLSAAMPKTFELVVDTAQLSFVDAAQRLSKLVKRGVMSAQEARLRLLKLGLEDCGTYVLNPLNPAGGGDMFSVSPAMTSAGLRDYLDEAYGLRGLPFARSVGALVADQAASEMESFLFAATGLPPNLGGLGLPIPEMNASKALDECRELMLNHSERLTPDLLWRKLHTLLEYLGKEPHEGAAAQTEDMSRLQDWQVLGFDALPVYFQHVKNPTVFNRFAMRLAKVLEQNGARGVVAWVSELLSDSDFLAKQRVLFKVMLPAVVDR